VSVLEEFYGTFDTAEDARKRAAITDGIPTDELEAMCRARREGRLTYDVRPDVMRFAQAMEAVLKTHDDRPGWEHESYFYLPIVSTKNMPN
jgi:hypothetical protein